jgi:hypothetical protein
MSKAVRVSGLHCYLYSYEKINLINLLSDLVVFISAQDTKLHVSTAVLSH